MTFAYLTGDMTDVKVLFGDIVAEQTEKGTFVVKKDGRQMTPHEYRNFWPLTPDSYALKRNGQSLIDIVFRNGRVFFSAEYAYKVGTIRPEREGGHLIAIILAYGTLIVDDWMDVRLFVPGYPRIELVDGMFLVAYIPNRPGPQVRVYNLVGELLSEGELWGAIYDARTMMNDVG